MSGIRMAPPSFYLPGKKGEPKPVPGAIAWYRFDEGSGQILHDYSGYGNHGTLGSTSGVDTNDPQWNAQGLVFGGDDLINMGLLPQLDVGSGDWTIQTILTSDSTVYRMVVGKPSTMDDQWGLYRATGGMIGIRSRGTTATTVVLSDAPVPLNTPTAITGVRSGTTGKLYVNDIKQTATGVFSDPTPVTVSKPFRIGASSSPEAYYYSGSIYFVAIYPFALTPAQVSQNYAYEKARLAPKGVILP